MVEEWPKRSLEIPRVGARTIPCLTPLRTSKASDVKPPKLIFASAGNVSLKRRNTLPEIVDISRP